MIMYAVVPAEAAERFGFDRHARRSMPFPSVVVIEEEEGHPGFFLYGYAPDGAFAGDTYHQSIDEALGQASYQYGIPSSAWRVIGDPPTDADSDLKGDARRFDVVMRALEAENPGAI